MVNFKYLNIILFSLPILAIGQPNLSLKQVIHEIEIYPDYHDSTIFYYAPPPLLLKKTSAGVPEFSFTKVRYTANENEGTSRDLDFGDISFNIFIPSIPHKTLAAVEKTISAEKEIHLLQIPISKIEIHLISAILNSGKQEVQVESFLSKNHTEVTVAGYYNFAKTLDRVQTQLLWNVLEQNGQPFYISYSYFSECFYPKNIPTITITGDTLEVLDIQKAVSTDSMNLQNHRILSNTVEIKVDAKKHPTLINEVDLFSDGLWIPYPLLEVMCFDFANNLREDLYKKIIRIKAPTFLTAYKSTVDIEIVFKSTEPDNFRRKVKFEEPVRMDLPFQYQVEEISMDGRSKIVTPWQNQKKWTFLDITSKS